MSFDPYLFFSGNCAEAFAFYGDVFGTAPQIMTAGDLPPGEEPMPGSDTSSVMHASIEIGGSYLMGSDDPTGDDGPKRGFSVSYTAADTADATRVFEALVAGGSATMPLEETFWSPLFGMLTDRFGVAWMIGVNAAEDATPN